MKLGCRKSTFNRSGSEVTIFQALELVQKMSYLVENPQERMSMGSESRRLAFEGFTADKMVEAYQRLYEAS